jgi:hypothetical protein
MAAHGEAVNPSGHEVDADAGVARVPAGISAVPINPSYRRCPL